ncbi:MAG: glycosyltransferase, partial [Aureliella sp.]
MLTLTIAMLLLMLAALPTLMVYSNLPLFHRAVAARVDVGKLDGGVSVLIPARNEEPGIGAAICSALASIGVDVEVVVMDDHSTDCTASVVEELAGTDSRVRLVRAPDLPGDWNGKQHACWHLSQIAKFDRLLFMDADVRLEPSAIARLVAEQTLSGCSLLSGFPRQLTPTLA